jgi:hypothetical protein
MANIDSIVFKEKTPYEKEFDTIETGMFDDGWKKIDLPPPPKNSSSQTKSEIDVLKNKMKEVTREQKKQIHKEDAKYPPFELLFADIIKKDDPKLKKTVSDLADQIFKIVIYFKHKFNRARPKQLADGLGIPFEPIKSETAHSPSYPSGHAFASYMLAYILGDLYPKKFNELMNLAERVSENRMRAGVHFPSDIDGAKWLAKRVLPYYKKNKKLHFKEWFN